MVVAGNATVKPLAFCYTYVGSSSCTPDSIFRNQTSQLYLASGADAMIDTYTLRKYQKHLYLPLQSYDISAASVAALAAAQLTGLSLTVQIPQLSFAACGEIGQAPYVDVQVRGAAGRAHRAADC